MGRHLCCNQQKVKRGLWSPEEDEKLVNYITNYGHGCWSEVPEKSGLQRCGKSCRLRWINYLRPDIRRGNFTPQEEKLIIHLHRMVGNRWAYIASHLPGRTDNEIKNYWNSWIKKKLAKAETISRAEASKHRLLQFMPKENPIGNDKESPLYTAGITFSQSNSAPPQIDAPVKHSSNSGGLVNRALWNYITSSTSISPYTINEESKTEIRINNLGQIDSEAGPAKDQINNFCEFSSGYPGILITSKEDPQLQYRQNQVQSLPSYENAFHSYSLDSIAGPFYFDPDSKNSNGIHTSSSSGNDFLSCMNMPPVYPQHEMLDSAVTLWESGTGSNVVGSLKCSYNEEIEKCCSYLPQVYDDSEESTTGNVVTDQPNFAIERSSQDESRIGDESSAFQCLFACGQQDINLTSSLECYGSQVLLQDISQQLFD